jgi:hypothetical protein
MSMTDGGARYVNWIQPFPDLAPFEALGIPTTPYGAIFPPPRAPGPI